jgi:hypothetical protein
MGFMKKKYLIRHKILQTLQEKLSEFDGKQKVQSDEIELSTKEISLKANLSEKDILAQIDYLSSRDEIHLERDKGVVNLYITRQGTVSFSDKSYLEEGKKEFWNSNYDVLKTVSTVILLLIALITFAINIFNTKKNKSEIEKMQIQIDNIRQQSFRSDSTTMNHKN